jgi:hypothetical protein
VEAPPSPHPRYDEIVERHTEWGVEGIADVPSDWWIELGAIGPSPTP